MSWLRWLRSPGGTFWGVPDWGGESAPAVPRPEDLLVEECAAFLSGHLAEVAPASGSRSPWVFTNLLAHGSEDELRAERSRAPQTLWEAARVRLAAGVLEVARTCGPLIDLQRELLVPLELDLASDPETARWEPQRLVVRVSDALNRYRLAHEHSKPREGRARHGEEPGAA